MALDLLLLSVAMPTLLLSAPLEPVALVPDKTNAANIQHTMPQMGCTHHGAKQAFRLSHFPSSVQQHHLTTGHVTNGQSLNATNGQHSPWCKTGISPFSLSKLFPTGFPDTMWTRQMGNSSRHRCAALTSEPKRFIIRSFRSHCIITA